MAYGDGRYPYDPYPNVPFNNGSTQTDQFYGGPRNLASMSLPNPAPSNTNQNFSRRCYCRPVNNENDIIPNEVSMTGTPSFFPAFDGSFIIAKAWTSAGTIQTVRYYPEVVDNKNEDNPSENIEMLSRKVDTIISMLSNELGMKIQNEPDKECGDK